MSEQPYLTAEGEKKIRQELAFLKDTGRIEIAARLRSAIQMGDLSENADYHKAKEDQGFLEGRIQELEYILQKAIIVSDFVGKRDFVDVGAKVVIQEGDEEPETYMLVGAKEASPRTGKISNESPIGKALIGHQAGDTVKIQTPGGEIKLKIIRVE